MNRQHARVVRKRKFAVGAADQRRGVPYFKLSPRATIHTHLNQLEQCILLNRWNGDHAVRTGRNSVTTLPPNYLIKLAFVRFALEREFAHGTDLETLAAAKRSIKAI